MGDADTGFCYHKEEKTEFRNRPAHPEKPALGVRATHSLHPALSQALRLSGSHVSPLYTPEEYILLMLTLL
jgi:hypothetical protein